MKAVCTMPVQVYDDGLTGVYQPGQLIDGAAAKLLVERYPEYFQARPEPQPQKGGKE